MTKKQKQNYNRMVAALKTIWKGYMTPDQLKRQSDKEYGLDYQDALEMAYENIQNLAKQASVGVRPIKDAIQHQRSTTEES